MRIKIGLDSLAPKSYTFLINDLAPYAPCAVIRDAEGVSVETEGDVVKCMCVVAICDRYRFGGKEDE